MGASKAASWVFAPLEAVKRMQFAKMVCGAMDIAVTEDSWLDSAPPFPDLGADVADDVYPHDFVAAAFAAGIIKGDNGKFKPYDGIYRIGVILMVVRALDSLAPGALDAVPAGFTFDRRWTSGRACRGHEEGLSTTACWSGLRASAPVGMPGLRPVAGKWLRSCGTPCGARGYLSRTRGEGETGMPRMRNRRGKAIWWALAALIVVVIAVVVALFLEGVI